MLIDEILDEQQKIVMVMGGGRVFVGEWVSTNDDCIFLSNPVCYIEQAQQDPKTGQPIPVGFAFRPFMLFPKQEALLVRYDAVCALDPEDDREIIDGYQNVVREIRAARVGIEIPKSLIITQ